MQTNTRDGVAGEIIQALILLFPTAVLAAASALLTWPQFDLESACWRPTQVTSHSALSLWVPGVLLSVGIGLKLLGSSEQRGRCGPGHRMETVCKVNLWTWHLELRATLCCVTQRALCRPDHPGTNSATFLLSDFGQITTHFRTSCFLTSNGVNKCKIVACKRWRLSRGLSWCKLCKVSYEHEGSPWKVHVG